MPEISLKKIAILILGLIVLFNLRRIGEAIEPVFEWFSDSLHGLNDFPEGAQTAIAFLSLVLLVVLIVKHFQK